MMFSHGKKLTKRPKKLPLKCILSTKIMPERGKKTDFYQVILYNTFSLNQEKGM